MELDGIYENVIQRNTVPQTGKGLFHQLYIQGQTTNVLADKRTRIILVVLTLLVLLLAAALLAVTYLNLQMNAARMDSEALMWKAHFEKATASNAVLRGQNDILKALLSEMYAIYNGNLYYFSCTEKSWEEAEKICVSKGSHLTSVTSVDEQQFLYKRANGTLYWNGLNRREDQKTFRWTDGTVFDEAKTKEFWKPGEPNNSYDSEDCVHFSEQELQSWNDLNCDSALQFICKWNCESSGLCKRILAHKQ